MIKDNTSNIFILDDMQSELDLMKDILDNAGYSTFTSNNTKQFYRLLEQYDADLILLDIVMPKTDGFSVCAELKKNPKNSSIPIMFLTSLTSNEDIKKGLELGAIDFISKPFNKDIFLLRITKALEQHKQLRKYNALFNQMSEGSCLLEPIYNEKNELIDTRHLDYNRAYSNIAPFRKRDLYNKTWLELIPDTDNSWFEAIDEILKSQQKSSFIKYIESTNKWFSVKVNSISKKSFALILSDISEQKRLEESLRESEKKYRSLFENAKEPVALIKNNQCVECNQATLDAFGFDNKTDFLNAKPWQISPKYQPDGTLSKHKAKEIIEIIRETKQHSFEWLNTHTSGAPIWFHISVAQISLKEEELFYTILRDITNRKKAELALIKSEEKYRLIADNISDLVWKTDMNLNFTYVSPSIINVRGYTQREALQQNLHEILNPESIKEVQNHFQLKLNQVRNGVPEAWENVVLDIMLKHKNGSYIWAQISARFIKPKSGLPTEIIGVTRDITKQKMAEIALSQSQEKLVEINEDKDKFISILSHDLIGSIGASIQVIEMLEHKGATWDSRNTYIDYLFKNTKSSFDLLSNLVAWGKASLGKNLFNPKQLTLNPIIEEVKQLYHVQLVQKNIRLINHIKSEQQVFADEHMLNTIYRNLVRNAIKFTNKGGCIELNMENKDNLLILEVKDDGIGMSDEKAKNLFSIGNIESEAGTQGEKGTGLGLQIAKEYVAKHKGEIWVNSKLGRGTTVYFSIP